MESLLQKTERLSRVFVWIGGSLIILSAILVTIEVFLRKIFNFSIGGADELSGYAFGIATSFGFAFALFERAHIRVDALYNLFPAKLQILANVLGIALLAGFVGVVSWMAWGLVADTLSYGSHSITPMRTPLAIPQIPWLVGWLFFLLCCVLLIVGAAGALLRGDYVRANKLIGTKTIDEQIEEETV
ncbi:TRAP transporter small permease subunit [Rhodovibrionaceae bacterium A322]